MLLRVYETLSPRQHEILILVRTGLTHRAIARQLGLSVHTIRAHLRVVRRKMDTQSTWHAIEIARQRGLFPTEKGAGDERAA